MKIPSRRATFSSYDSAGSSYTDSSSSTNPSMNALKRRWSLQRACARAHFTVSGPPPSRVQKNRAAPTRPTKVAKLSLKATWPGTNRCWCDSSWITVETTSTSSARSTVDRIGSLNHPRVEKADVGRR